MFAHCKAKITCCPLCGQNWRQHLAGIVVAGSLSLFHKATQRTKSSGRVAGARTPCFAPIHDSKCARGPRRGPLARCPKGAIEKRFGGPFEWGPWPPISPWKACRNPGPYQEGPPRAKMGASFRPLVESAGENTSNHNMQFSQSCSHIGSDGPPGYCARGTCATSWGPSDWRLPGVPEG